MNKIYTTSSLYLLEFTSTSFKKYLRIVEDNFQIQIDALREQFADVSESLNSNSIENEYQESIKDNLIEAMIEIDVEFINRFRRSVIIQLFSYLEVELKKHCDAHCRYNKKEYSVDDLKGYNELDKIK